MAEEFAESIGATKKFVDFLIAHLPPPPEKRPSACEAQIDWSPENLKRIFRQVYGYRSKALHDGRPFPAQMCEPPFRFSEGEDFSEKPFGLAASSHGSSWLIKDTPILLNTFEYTVRSAIIRWWKQMA